MPDLEKAIKDAEYVIRLSEFGKRYERRKTVIMKTTDVENILDCLKAQEPVEPLAEYSVHTGSKWAICGKCYEPLAKASDKEKPNYCSFCGRAVKWNG